MLKCRCSHQLAEELHQHQRVVACRFRPNLLDSSEGVIGIIGHTVEDRTTGSDLPEGESIHLAGDTTTVISRDSHQTIWTNFQQTGSHATTVGRPDSVNVRA